MKLSRRFLVVGFVSLLVLSLATSGPAQVTSTPVAFQSAYTWPGQTAGSVSLPGFDVRGKLYFTVDWAVSGTVSGCTVTLDGATAQGGNYSTGSIVTSQTCTSSGSFTTSSASENVSAQLTYTIAGSGSVTFTVKSFAQNPAAGGGGGSTNATIVNPLDGSGYVNVDCKTGCTGGNPNGQATMANSAPVVIASNQSQVPVLATEGSQTEVTAAWTSATALNTTLQQNTAGYNTANVYLNQGSTITGGVVSFEGSDTTAFTNAYPLLCVQGNSSAQGTTYTLQASTNQEWDCDISAFVAFRVRLSTVITGTGTVNVGITTSSVGTTPDVSVGGSVSVSGTVTANQGAPPWQDNVTQVGGQSISLYALLFNAQLATGTATSSAIRLPNFSASGTLWISGTSITGSPSGCQIAVELQGSNGAPASSAIQTISFTPGNSYQDFALNVSSPHAYGDTAIGVYSCTGYPSGGTISAGISPGLRTMLADGAGNALTSNSSSPGRSLDLNLVSVLGSAVSTAASGVIKTGITGSGAASLDAAVGAASAPTNGLDTLAQYNTSSPAPTNAQTASVQSDQSGNVLTTPGIAFKAGAAWSSATTINTLQYPTGTTTAGQLTGAAAVMVQLDQTTTLTAGAVTFQGTYDNVNWVTIPVAQVLNPNTYAQLTNPYTFVASTNQPFLLLLQGYINVRANLTTLITGTGTVTPEWATISSTNFVSQNLAEVAGNPVGTVASGVQKVGVSDSAGNGVTSNSTTQSRSLDVNLVSVNGASFAATNPVFVSATPSSAAALALSASSQSSLTTAVVVKASSGGLYGLQVTNGSASACYLEFINAASAPTLGTNAVYSFQVPASSTLTLPASMFQLSNFSTGISVGMATAYNGSSACGSAATAVIFYK